MAASFSLAGTLRVVPTWTDDLNTTTVVDSATALLSFTLTDGTGNGQANGFYKDVVTIAASSTTHVDLRALPLNVFGGTGTLSLASVKALLLYNRSAASALFVAVPSDANAVSVANRWTAFASDTVILAAGGVLYATNFNSGWATTASNKVLAVTNPGGSAADVEIYIAGVKT